MARDSWSLMECILHCMTIMSPCEPRCRCYGLSLKYAPQPHVFEHLVFSLNNWWYFLGMPQNLQKTRSAWRWWVSKWQALKVIFTSGSGLSLLLLPQVESCLPRCKEAAIANSLQHRPSPCSHHAFWWWISTSGTQNQNNPLPLWVASVRILAEKQEEQSIQLLSRISYSHAALDSEVHFIPLLRTLLKPRVCIPFCKCDCESVS